MQRNSSVVIIKPLLQPQQDMFARILGLALRVPVAVEIFRQEYAARLKAPQGHIWKNWVKKTC